MQLTHRFTVPATVEETWAAFDDIASVAACFPGATVTSVEGEEFQGSCKVKLGPIALVYNGSGRFTEKDATAHRMVIAAKGKDKRGNGTAGADVVATMTAAGEKLTDIEVVTDLAITGKPAQFGRGVMQDVSDKLLGQFVACLEQRFTDAPADADAGPSSAPTGAAVVEAPDGDPDKGPSSAPRPEAPADSTAGTRPAPRPAPAQQDDALDLGAAVVPILLKTYGKQLAAGLGVLLVLRWILRRRH